jgi:MarR family transcriptional regulator, lower aerobic nicotinate degradation pathway regulator
MTPQIAPEATLQAAAETLPFWPLTERPGFLIRRLHQIHVALFSEHCAQFDITPVQYSLLSALSSRGRADQTSLAADILLDRTTTTGALSRLEARGLVERVTSRRDRRARECRLTPFGAETLARMEAAARQAHHDTISALSPADRRTLLDLMNQLVAAHGDRATDGP